MNAKVKFSKMDTCYFCGTQLDTILVGATFDHNVATYVEMFCEPCALLTQSLKEALNDRS